MEGVYNSLVLIDLIMEGIVDYSGNAHIIPAHEWEESQEQLNEILNNKNKQL